MRVLIVEDDPFVAIDLERIVLEAFAADIRIAGSLAEAWLCVAQPIDFVFLDVDLPDGPSYEVAADLLRRQVPFAFVSGASPMSAPVGLGDAPFIAKPYQPSQIAQTLRSAQRS